MLTTFLIVFEQMIRIMLVLGVGFALNRLNVLPKSAKTVLSRLITLLLLPAITLYTNLVECRVDSLLDNLPLVLYGGIICLLIMLVAVLLARLFEPERNYQQGIYRYAFAFTNTGAVALPLVLALSGTALLFQLNLFLFFTGIFTYTWGIAQLKENRESKGMWAGLRQMVNANFVAMLIGMTLGVLGAKEWLPTLVMDAVGDLGGCYAPVSLLLTGFTIADYPLGQVLGSRKSVLFSVFRLILIPGAFLMGLRLLGASDAVCLLTVLSYACPCGMNTVIYPLSYGQDCRSGVSMVLISSLASMLTMPLMYALATL